MSTIEQQLASIEKELRETRKKMEKAMAYQPPPPRELRIKMDGKEVLFREVIE
jgi:hypothetical protein